jgi:hypothetical protein
VPYKGYRGSWGGVHRTGVAVIASAIRARERRIAQRLAVTQTRMRLLEDGGEADRWACGPGGSTGQRVCGVGGAEQRASARIAERGRGRIRHAGPAWQWVRRECAVRSRGWGEQENALAWVGPGSEVRAGWLAGLLARAGESWAAGTGLGREKSGSRAEEKRGRGLGRPGWAGAGLSWWAPWDGVWVVVFPFYFLFTILLTHTKLNSNKFESKNLFTQTNKEMLHHDATTKLNLC